MAGISLDKARKVVAGAEAKAIEIGVPMNIAVVDAGTNPTASVRHDGAWLGSVDIAQNKAYTARAFDMPTKDLYPEAQPGGSLSGTKASNDGRLIVSPGGIPVTEAAEVIGAVGVSGGSVDRDQTVSEAGVAAHA